MLENTDQKVVDYTEQDSKTEQIKTEQSTLSKSKLLGQLKNSISLKVSLKAIDDKQKQEQEKKIQARNKLQKHWGSINEFLSIDTASSNIQKQFQKGELDDEIQKTSALNNSMQSKVKNVKSRNLSVSFARESNQIEGLTKNYKAIPEINYNDGFVKLTAQRKLQEMYSNKKIKDDSKQSQTHIFQSFKEINSFNANQASHENIFVQSKSGSGIQNIETQKSLENFSISTIQEANQSLADLDKNKLKINIDSNKDEKLILGSYIIQQKSQVQNLRLNEIRENQKLLKKYQQKKQSVDLTNSYSIKLDNTKTLNKNLNTISDSSIVQSPFIPSPSSITRNESYQIIEKYRQINSLRQSKNVQALVRPHTNLPKLNSNNQIRFQSLNKVPKNIKMMFDKAQEKGFDPSGSHITQSAEGFGKFDTFVHKPPEKQFVITDKQVDEFLVNDRGNQRNILIKFQTAQNKLDYAEKYFEEQLKEQQSLQENENKIKNKYKNQTPLVKSIRSQAELEFFGIKERDQFKPKTNRLAEQLGIQVEDKKQKPKPENEEGQKKSQKYRLLKIHENVEKEIRENVVKADHNLDDFREDQKKQADRFKELHDDFNKRERYTKKVFDTQTDDRIEQFTQYNEELVQQLMKDNIVIKEETMIQKRKKKKVHIEEKILDLLIEQLDQSKIKKKFEKITSLLGITNSQFLAIQHFENYYKSRKNLGLEQMEKNKDIVLAKELFSCWDEKRIGTINIDTLAENLISFGLSMSRDQVVKLIQAISNQGKEYKKVEEITMKEFVKIFERDPFGDKVVDKIKEEWEADRKAQLEKIVSKIIRKRSISGSKVSDSDVQSIHSLISKGSKFSKGNSMYGTFMGSKWGTTGGMSNYQLNKIDIKPSIQEQIAITKQWWQSINQFQDAYLPLSVIKKFYVSKGFVQDAETAEKIIISRLGKIQELEYSEFYKIFCKAIFRIALQDMLNNIQQLSKDQQDLPLAIKLSSFRRNLLLSGLDKENSEQKEKGKSILYALKLYKNEVDPQMFDGLEFAQFVQDPLGLQRLRTQEMINKEKLTSFQNSVIYKKIKQQGQEIGIDTKEIEKKLLGLDDQTIREILKEIKEEKKGQQFKPIQKFDIDKLNMKVINEIEDEELDEDISYNSDKQDGTNEKRKKSNNKKGKDQTIKILEKPFKKNKKQNARQMSMINLKFKDSSNDPHHDNTISPESKQNQKSGSPISPQKTIKHKKHNSINEGSFSQAAQKYIL